MSDSFLIMGQLLNFRIQLGQIVTNLNRIEKRICGSDYSTSDPTREFIHNSIQDLLGELQTWRSKTNDKIWQIRDSRLQP